MFEPTSVTHHFVLSLRKVDLSTAHWSASFPVVTRLSQGPEPECMTSWRIDYVPNPPMLVLVEDMAGCSRKQGGSMHLRRSVDLSTSATVLVCEETANQASPVTIGRAVWDPHAALLGWSTAVERCKIDGGILRQLVMDSQ
ncbi:BQ2448_6254 [Microbotryum intermedium]|uniref:BQ2448_6254 protein n=1 Tax=Microbotryum intermedium TaxID=269621 RepID=A0A238FPK7_9BASI|nr:BQ2448_6254 [Microbotryum intermedium]